MTRPVYAHDLTAGDVLRLERERQGRVQRQTAHAVGITAGHLCDVERNRPAHILSEETMTKLAALLGLDAWELMLRDGRVPAEVADALRRDPTQGAAVLRAMTQGVGR